MATIAPITRVFPLEYGPERIVALGAVAGGLAWGIRGQYGHETGAMLAGLLLGLVWFARIYPWKPWSEGAPAIALFTLAMGLGGSMTYGQTVGLTQDAPLIGAHDALSWGFLGLAIKGGLWWGLGGLFLGLGFGGGVWRPWAAVGAFLGAFGLFHLGVFWLNEPFDPLAQELPRIYFSDAWRWEPEGDLRPRREVWGGLALVWLSGLLYFGAWKRYPLVWRLGLWGAVAGAVGFPLGQSLQAFQAWRPEVARPEFWGPWITTVNWWNLMEIVFGAVAGAILGLGLWTHRRWIREPVALELVVAPRWADRGWAMALVAHVALLILVEFARVPLVDAAYDLGLTMIWIPVAGAMARPYWSLAIVGPLTALPFVGKTLRELVFRQEWLEWGSGCVYLVGLPLVALSALTLSRRGARWSADVVAAVMIGVYWGLNSAFFQFPPLSEPWNGRTPSFLALTGLAVLAIGLSWRGSAERHP